MHGKQNRGSLGYDSLGQLDDVDIGLLRNLLHRDPIRRDNGLCWAMRGRVPSTQTYRNDKAGNRLHGIMLQ